MAIRNLIMVITQPSHSNTGLFCPVFRCHSKTRPFANRTTFDHLNTGLVQYSDGYCNCLLLSDLGRVVRDSLPRCPAEAVGHRPPHLARVWRDNQSRLASHPHHDWKLGLGPFRYTYQVATKNWRL